MTRKKSLQLLMPNPENIHWIRQRNWQLLQYKSTISLHSETKQIIESCAKQWFLKGRRNEYLLRGESLIIAEKFYKISGDRFSFNARKYIISSIEHRDKTESLDKYKQHRLCATFIAIITVLSTFSLSTAFLNTTIEAKISKISGSTYSVI